MARAVIFDLGGTLVDWPGWDDGLPLRWAASYGELVTTLNRPDWPPVDAYVRAMREAELEHWQHVVEENWSGPPSGVVASGLRRLGRHPEEAELLLALDCFARAIDGWAVVEPSVRETLTLLRERGYRLGLLSNTWWAAAWHNADLATHGLAGYFDELVYTSDLQHSKPHPSVFLEVAARLGVQPTSCVMVGDRMIDDIEGAMAVGMQAVWRRNEKHSTSRNGTQPTAHIDKLSELPPILSAWSEH